MEILGEILTELLIEFAHITRSVSNDYGNFCSKNSELESLGSRLSSQWVIGGHSNRDHYCQSWVENLGLRSWFKKVSVIPMV